MKSAFYLVGLVVLMASQSVVHADDSQATSATTARVVSIALPEGAYRYQEKGVIAQFATIVQKMAAESKQTVGDLEVLVWKGATGSDTDVNQLLTDKSVETPDKALPKLLAKAGYDYKAQPSKMIKDFEVTSFTTTNKKKKRAAFGVWFKKDGVALLSWGTLMSAKPKAQNVPTSGGKIPAEMVGSWKRTSVSTNIGMSRELTFTRDGRYKLFVTGRSEFNQTVKTWNSSEEGTVTFAQDRFILRPKILLSNGKITKATTYFWEWRTEDGKPHLYMGLQADAMVPYERQ